MAVGNVDNAEAPVPQGRVRARKMQESSGRGARSRGMRRRIVSLSGKGSTLANPAIPHMFSVYRKTAGRAGTPWHCFTCLTARRRGDAQSEIEARSRPR
jgi:hypothetical protein